jgi:hypothetical protein
VSKKRLFPDDGHDTLTTPLLPEFALALREYFRTEQSRSPEA